MSNIVSGRRGAHILTMTEKPLNRASAYDRLTCSLTADTGCQAPRPGLGRQGISCLWCFVAGRRALLVAAMAAAAPGRSLQDNITGRSWLASYHRQMARAWQTQTGSPVTNFSRHCGCRMLSLWQPTVLPVTTKLLSSPVFRAYHINPGWKFFAKLGDWKRKFSRENLTI